VTQRGNFQQETFLTEEDRERYLEWLALYAKQFGTQFWAWCLMTTHVHFVAVPEREDSLARTFHRTHQRYSLHLNKRLKRCGHLWQGRFFSCPLDECHAYLAVRYVERNPVRAGLAAESEEYAWSSARGHVYRCRDPLVTEGNPFERSIPDWKAYLSEGESEEWRAALKRATLSGRPLGSERFVERMEEAVGRRLHALPRGRPRKEGEAGA
jgi:putative transposase